MNWPDIIEVLHWLLTVSSCLISLYLYYFVLPKYKNIKQAEVRDVAPEPISSPIYEQQIEELRKKLEEKDSVIKEYDETAGEFLELINSRPLFQSKGKDRDSVHRMEVENFIKKFLGVYHVNVDMNEMTFFFKRTKLSFTAMSNINNLQKHMNDLYMELQKQTPARLTDDQKRKNLILILNTGMMAFDCIANTGEEQSLNRKISDGTLTRAEALSMAKPVSNSTETSKWIRVIKESIESAGIRGSNIIISEYKL